MPKSLSPATSIAFSPGGSKSGIVFGTRRGAHNRSGFVRIEAGTTKPWVVHELRGALRPQPRPNKRPSLTLVPQGGQSAWTLACYGPGFGHMSVLDRGSGAWFSRHVVPVIGTVVVDLDRDGHPELIDLGSTGAALDIAPGFDASRIQDRHREWLGLLDGASQIVAWDLDEDHEEDLLVSYRGDRATVLVGHGRFQFTAGVAAGIRQAAGSGIEVDRIRLGPVRGERQWGVAWAAGAMPWLLMREARSRVFTARPLFPNKTEQPLVDQLRVLDARVLDVDADGEPDLVLLCLESATSEPQVRLYRLPKTLDANLSPIGSPLPLPGALLLAVGDLEGDGAPDLAIARYELPPVVLRNTSVNAFARRSVRITLEDADERWHAVASYVELWVGDERASRHRWPPLVGRDHNQLWLTLTAQEATSELRVQVTWVDGNFQWFDVELGRLLNAKRD